MKRMLGLMLLLLLLCGCTARPQEETTMPPTTETTQKMTEPTEPVGIYVPYSDLEIQTDGAVRYYLPEPADCYGMLTMGSDVLLFSGTEKTTLTRLAGDSLYTVASQNLDCRVEPDDPSFQISQNGITYYDSRDRELIFLDNDLKEVSRLGMSGSMVGIPVLSSSRMQVYYCTADAIRVYDMGTGLDKLIKSISYPAQSVEGIFLNDSVLRCSLTDEQGFTYAIFISTETGELMAQIQQNLMVTTVDDSYYAVIRDDVMDMLLFGTVGDEPMLLNPVHVGCDAWFLESRNQLVTSASLAGGNVVDCYDLATGQRVYSLELPENMTVQYVQAEDRGDGIYLMGCDRMAEQNVICLWQPERNAVSDETVYTSRRYTAENPDTKGLTDCRAYADAIGKQHGVQILIEAAAVETQPWDYTLEMEYRVSVVSQQLKKLEQLLASFPEGFFDSLGGKINICIVRSITENAASGGVGSAQGLQFWDGGRTYVILASGDTLEYSLFHELFHVIDGKVLSNSLAYYHWHERNPQDFRYFEDYTSWQSVGDSPYLQEDQRAFIDAYSMSYPKEDRARIMEYACTEGNEEYFRSEIMQAKLRTLCQGIREAFGLKNHPEPLLWEQYLIAPLAP